MKLLKNISFFTAITILTSVVSFLLLPIMTKHLSTEDYGVLSIFNALIRFIVAFISLGSINVLMVSLINEKKEAFNLELRAFFQISLNNAFLFSFLIAIYIYFFDSFFGLPNWLSISTPLIALGITSFEAVSGITVFKNQHKEYAKIILSKFFIEILFSLLLIVGFGFNWIGRVSGVLLGLMASLIISYRYLKQQDFISFTLDKRTLNRLIKSGSPLILMNISIMVMNLSDRFFIEKMVGISDTGVYNVGAVIGGIELIIVNASIAVFRPMIYRYLKENKKSTQLQLINLILLITTFIGIYLFTDLIFYLLVDESFYEAKQYVLPISLGFLFWGVSNYYISYFIFYKKNKYNIAISLFSMVLNLILNYFLIKDYSTIGAAYATTITYFFMAIIIYIVSLKFNNYD